MPNLIAEYIQARKEANEAEELLKMKKQEVAYIEEVMYFEGERQIIEEEGKVNISETSYASVRKGDYQKLKYFLKKEFEKEIDDFLESEITTTKQKKLAKLFESILPPDFIKIYERFTFKLFLSKSKNR